MKNLIQDTISRIKEQHIRPEPRWKFVLRKIGLWILIGLVAFLASASISVVYFLLSQLDWDLYRFSQHNRIFFFFSMVPYFWLILLAIFAAGVFWGVRRTENGYRFNWLKIVAVTVAGLILLGFLLSYIGLDRHFNNVMMKRMPYYANNIETKEKQWMQPEQGFLSGVIKDISKDGLSIRDLDGADWNVEVSEKTFVRPMARIEKGEMIKIIGTKKGGKTFEALEIRPWRGRGEMMMGPGYGRGMMR